MCVSLQPNGKVEGVTPKSTIQSSSQYNRSNERDHITVLELAGLQPDMVMIRKRGNREG